MIVTAYRIAPAQQTVTRGIDFELAVVVWALVVGVGLLSGYLLGQWYGE
ncbi:hypothetical protein [Halosimplex marinum]